MRQEELDLLVSDPEKLKDALVKERLVGEVSNYLKEYDPSTHAVTDPGKRPDKIIQTETGASSVPVARLAVPLQKQIVFSAAAFLCGNPIQLESQPQDQLQEDLLVVMNKTLDDNKVTYKNLEMAQLLFSETEVAEVWYAETITSEDAYWLGTPNEKATTRLRMKVLANSKGDALYPSFDEFGDMNAFARGYFVQEGDEKVERLDVYTAENIYQFKKGKSGWEEVAPASSNMMGKIPVIYYHQKHPEWKDVQSIIERFELSISKHADTNDYFGSPMVKLKGDVKGFAKKGEDGKVIQLEAGAEAEYMTWDQSPESVKLEQTNLRSLIFDSTATPDISFTQMSKLGTFSGIAIKLLFMSAHLKAATKEQIFGEGVQRRINLIKAAMIKINPKMEKAKNLSIKPVFTYFLPKDIEGEIDILNSAVQGGIISKKTAVEKNPLVNDPDEELKRLQEEQEDPKALDDLNNEEPE